jgi:thymidine kinase
MCIIAMNDEVTMTMENNNESCGYLELIAGPMYSGKTSKLLDIYKKYNFCDMKTLVINYAEDTRYSPDMLSTHERIMIPCVRGSSLKEVADIVGGSPTEEFMKASIILINEGQFFKDIVPWVIAAVEEYKKTVYVCGLDGDFQRNRFGNWLDLVPMCDKVTKLHSFCNKCKRKPAIFSYRVSDETTQKLIGSDSYIPLCRFCYNLQK